MRDKLTGMKLENLRRERDCWRKRAEIKQRLQDRKEEAWELFRRPKLREEFEREYTRRVMRGSSSSPFSNSGSEEKSLREWAEELLKNAQAEERRREARESQKMGQEDASSEQRQSWDKLRERYPLSSLLRTV